MFSFFRSKKDPLKTTSEEKIKKTSFETVRSWAPWRSLSTATRLNFMGTITSILDTAMGLATKNPSINNFVTTCLPFSISYYLIPSCISVAATLSCKETQSASLNNVAFSLNAKEFLDALTIDDEEFRNFLISHPKEIYRLLDKIKQFQEKDDTDNLDIIINSIYFFLRAIRGSIIILEAFNLTSKETKNTISDVATISYGVFNIGYTGFMLAHHLYKSHVKVNHYSKIHGLFLSAAPDPTIELDTVTIDIATNSESSSEYTLLTSHPQRLEATRSKWHSTINIR